MKQIFLTLLCAVFSTLSVSAQLCVSDKGNVTIGTDSASSYKMEVVDTVGAKFRYVGHILSNMKGLWLQNKNYSDSKHGYANALFVHSIQGAKTNVATRSMALGASTDGALAVGVLGIAGGHANGSSYGVIGNLTTGTKGVGVYGSVDNSMQSDCYGTYAGLFNGNVKVYNGTVNATVVTSSDSRLKSNVQAMEAGDALSGVSLLTPVTFTYNDNQGSTVYLSEDANGDLAVSSASSTDSKSHILSDGTQRTHYGLIAQEVREVYPDMVYEGEDGYLSVNYTELIPVLIQSVKELRAEVEALKSAATQAQAHASYATSGIDAQEAGNAAGYARQNDPNPFSGKTEIEMFVPQGTAKAVLGIYNLDGSLVEQHEIADRGTSSHTLYANRLEAGTYLYTLTLDGNTVSTRKMIVKR